MVNCRPPGLTPDEGSAQPLGGTHLLCAGSYQPYPAWRGTILNFLMVGVIIIAKNTQCSVA
ncbi:MAG: hypothetical protein WCN92_13210, partial [Eubacteriales bacterium]